MNASAAALERRLRMAGVFIILGLLTEAVCLFWARPFSFLAFISIGGAFLFFGLVTYLLSLVSIRSSSPPSDS